MSCSEVQKMVVCGKIKPRLVYPWHVHFLHIALHLAYVIPAMTSDPFADTDKTNGPGGKLRNWTSWAIWIQGMFYLSSLAFDIAILFVKRTTMWKLRAHLDTFYVVMFCADVGMGGLFHIQFIQACFRDHKCPGYYSDGLWFLHLMPMWWGLLEFLVVPHVSRCWWVEAGTVLTINVLWAIHYAIYHAVVKEHDYVYGDAWPVFQWCLYFIQPFLFTLAWFLALVRNLVQKRLFRRFPVRFAYLVRLYPDPRVLRFDDAMIEQARRILGEADIDSLANIDERTTSVNADLLSHDHEAEKTERQGRSNSGRRDTLTDTFEAEMEADVRVLLDEAELASQTSRKARCKALCRKALPIWLTATIIGCSIFIWDIVYVIREY